MAQNISQESIAIGDDGDDIKVDILPETKIVMAQDTVQESGIISDNVNVTSLHETDSSATEFEPLTDFLPFPRLPPEICSMIWKQTLPPSRAILLRFEKEPQESDGPENFKLVSSCSIPIALQVCQESRAEAKRHYQLGLANQFHEGRIYIDFKYDIVYLVWREVRTGNELNISPKMLNAFLVKDEADKIQNMAVSSIYSEHPRELIHLQSFHGLQQLSVEFEAREMPDRREVTLIEEEELRHNRSRSPFEDMGVLDRDFVLETFHEVRKACPAWKAPELRFVRSGAESITED